MMTVWGKQFGKWFGVCLAIACCGLLTAMPVQAVTHHSANHQWQLTGESTDGLAQQYVALDSMRPGGAEHQWIVDSYFMERQAGGEVRADYVTLYDCDRDRYQDLNRDGLPASDWGDVTADPLNQATMDYVCQHLPPA